MYQQIPLRNSKPLETSSTKRGSNRGEKYKEITIEILKNYRPVSSVSLKSERLRKRGCKRKGKLALWNCCYLFYPANNTLASHSKDWQCIMDVATRRVVSSRPKTKPSFEADAPAGRASFFKREMQRAQRGGRGADPPRRATTSRSWKSDIVARCAMPRRCQVEQNGTSVRLKERGEWSG